LTSFRWSLTPEYTSDSSALLDVNIQPSLYSQPPNGSYLCPITLVLLVKSRPQTINF
jgi:hypothetical protein